MSTKDQKKSTNREKSRAQRDQNHIHVADQSVSPQFTWVKEYLKRVKDYELQGSFISGMAVVVILFGSVFFAGKFIRSRSVVIDRAIIVPEQERILPVVSQQQTVRQHTVQKGEGLWQVAQKYYTDGNKYQKIYEANKDVMRSPEDVREGMVLAIPE